MEPAAVKLTISFCTVAWMLAIQAEREMFNLPRWGGTISSLFLPPPDPAHSPLTAASPLVEAGPQHIDQTWLYARRPSGDYVPLGSLPNLNLANIQHSVSPTPSASEMDSTNHTTGVMPGSLLAVSVFSLVALLSVALALLALYLKQRRHVSSLHEELATLSLKLQDDEKTGVTTGTQTDTSSGSLAAVATNVASKGADPPLATPPLTNSPMGSNPIYQEPPSTPLPLPSPEPVSPPASPAPIPEVPEPTTSPSLGQSPPKSPIPNEEESEGSDNSDESKPTTVTKKKRGRRINRTEKARKARVAAESQVEMEKQIEEMYAERERVQATAQADAEAEGWGHWLRDRGY